MEEGKGERWGLEVAMLQFVTSVSKGAELGVAFHAVFHSLSLFSSTTLPLHVFFFYGLDVHR